MMIGRLFGRTERRSSVFTERLSLFMALVAAFGGIYVILDPVITVEVSWGEVKIGGDGFSEQLKGAVVAMILIEGWKAVKEYWLGSSAVAAAAAATTNGVTTDHVEVDAQSVNVTEEKKS